tara:strand:+ start:205 stop:396 length:192 start_codon:yes stop_codon:yes gene_type:complete
VRSILKKHRKATITTVAIPAPKLNYIDAIGTTRAKTKEVIMAVSLLLSNLTLRIDSSNEIDNI